MGPTRVTAAVATTSHPLQMLRLAIKSQGRDYRSTGVKLRLLLRGKRRSLTRSSPLAASRVSLVP